MGWAVQAQLVVRARAPAAAGVALVRLVVQQPSFVLCLARTTGWPGSQRRPKAVDLCSREPAIALPKLRACAVASDL